MNQWNVETLEKRTLLAANSVSTQTSPADVRMLTSFADESTQPSNLVTNGASLYFTTIQNDGAGALSFWKSDGSNPPVLLRQFSDHGHRTAELVSFGDSVVAIIGDANHNNCQLWRVGSKAGLLRVKSSLGKVSLFGVTEDRAMFLSRLPSGSYAGDLWGTDGAVEGTQLLRSYPSSNRSIFSEPVAFQGKLYFEISGKLWRTNGTTNGTKAFSAWFDLLSAKPTAYANFSLFKDQLFFSATDSVNGRALWRTNGTPEGTGLVKDLWTNKAEGPRLLIAAQHRLYFLSDDIITGQWRLYQTNGTASGTRHVFTFAPNYEQLADFVTVGDDVYFTNAADYVHELWRSDGNATTQQIATDDSIDMLSFDNQLYLVKGSQNALYSAAGDDIHPVAKFSQLAPRGYIENVTPFGNRLLFTARLDDDHAPQVWSYRPQRTLTGSVFSDPNSNGVRDTGETGFSGWRVFIDTDRDSKWDEGELFIRTNGQGRFSFDLTAGSYRLCVTPVTGHNMTTVSQYTVTVPIGGTITRSFGAK